MIHYRFIFSQTITLQYTNKLKTQNSKLKNSIYPSIHPSVRPSVRPSIHSSIRPSVTFLNYNQFLFNYLFLLFCFTCFSVNLLICQSVYQSICRPCQPCPLFYLSLCHSICQPCVCVCVCVFLCQVNDLSVSLSFYLSTLSYVSVVLSVSSLSFFLSILSTLSVVLSVCLSVCLSQSVSLFLFF